MLAALRYRPAQAVVVGVLSALVTTCLVIAPLYTRALEQAMVAALLRDAPVQDSGLRLTSTSTTDAFLAVDPDDLVALVPAEVGGLFAAPVASSWVQVRRLPFGGEPGGRLLVRDGACAHVRFAQGRCPAARGEVAVSADQAKAYDQPLGTVVDVGEFDGTVSQLSASPRTTLRVVGVYEPVDSAYWFGDLPTGTAAQKLGYDDLLTVADTLATGVKDPEGADTSWAQPQYAADLALLPDRVDVDTIGTLGAAITDLTAYPMGVENAGSEVAATITVTSALPQIAEEARVGSEQASVTVPLLMAQLGLLLVCVLWLVLVAAADQRRAEVAVARLRGRGSAGARRMLLAETLPPVVLGVPLGAVLAALAVTVARATVLSPQPPFEVPLGAVVALLAGLVAMVALAVLSVRRVSRAPIADLTRSVPPRPAGVRLGVLEAMLVAAAVAAFAALVTGSVEGPLGIIAPTLLALAAGVVAARVFAAGLTVGGGHLLRSGRATAGAALLTASRRGATRWLVPVVAVALCLVVVSADALAVGARNWTGRAGAEVGAPTVLTLGSTDLAAVSAAVRGFDPDGAHVTPVALVQPGSQGTTATFGVVPQAFRHVALWPGVEVSALPWDRLTAPTVPPLEIRGTRVAYHVRAPAYVDLQPSVRPVPDAVSLGLRLVHADGTVEVTGLGTLPQADLETDQTGTVACQDGCRVSGIGILAPRGTASLTGSVTVSDLTVDGRPVDLGDDASWRDSPGDDQAVSGAVVDGALTVEYANGGQDTVFLPHASVPGVVPAITTPTASPSAAGATFAGASVDGSALVLNAVGQVPFVPGAPAATSMVKLDNLLAEGWRSRGSASLFAYVDTVDRALVGPLVYALEGRGIPVVATTYAEDRAAGYGSSAAAWSLQLALAVAVLSLLVAAVGIVVLTSTSWRARSRDYAALRLVGETRRGIGRLSQLETLPVVIASALLGAVVGLWAAPVAVGMVPLFTSTPPTYPVDLSPALVPAVTAGLAGLTLLALVGAFASAWVAGRSHVRRLRDMA